MLAIEARPFAALLAENDRASVQILRQVAQVYYRRYLETLRGHVQRAPAAH